MTNTGGADAQASTTSPSYNVTGSLLVSSYGRKVTFSKARTQQKLRVLVVGDNNDPLEGAVLSVGDTECTSRADGIAFEGFVRIQNDAHLVRQSFAPKSYEPLSAAVQVKSEQNRVRLANNVNGATLSGPDGQGYYTLTIQNVKTARRTYVYVRTVEFRDNADFMNQLKVRWIDPNGYSPVGAIDLPGSLFQNANSQAVIDSDADWDVVIDALANLDMAPLAGDGTLNAANTVAEYRNQVMRDIGQRAGSGQSALFAWSGDSLGFADNSIGYHLDLRFETTSITFVAGNNGIPDGAAKDGTTLGTQTYIKGGRVNSINLDVSGYAIAGYYLDANFTNAWSGVGSSLNDSVTVYVKFQSMRPVVIRKLGDQDMSTLSGATFALYAEDRTTEIAKVGTENVSSFFAASNQDKNGVFFAGELSYTTYWLKETKAPSGYESDKEQWYKIEVRLDDVVVSGPYTFSDSNDGNMWGSFTSGYKTLEAYEGSRYTFQYNGKTYEGKWAYAWDTSYDQNSQGTSDNNAFTATVGTLIWWDNKFWIVNTHNSTTNWTNNLTQMSQVSSNAMELTGHDVRVVTDADFTQNVNSGQPNLPDNVNTNNGGNATRYIYTDGNGNFWICVRDGNAKKPKDDPGAWINITNMLRL